MWTSHTGTHKRLTRQSCGKCSHQVRAGVNLIYVTPSPKSVLNCCPGNIYKTGLFYSSPNQSRIVCILTRLPNKPVREGRMSYEYHYTYGYEPVAWKYKNDRYIWPSIITQHMIIRYKRYTPNLIINSTTTTYQQLLIQSNIQWTSANDFMIMWKRKSVVTFSCLIPVLREPKIWWGIPRFPKNWGITWIFPFLIPHIWGILFPYLLGIFPYFRGFPGNLVISTGP